MPRFHLIFDVLENDGTILTSVIDGVKALELADAATRSWREQMIISLGE